jgi:enoyl-CoA hydratase/carnithine racemase
MGSVLLDVRDRIAYCTLNRPGASNAIDESMLSGLARAAASVAKDEDVKALVIEGAGAAFCIGLDIGLLGRAFDDHPYFRDVLGRFKRVLLDIEALPVPVVASVNGTARAGGFELMLACDLVLVAGDARVADHHLAFGIVPGGGATQRAPRKIGDQRARELIYSARWLTGDEAVDAGLALRAVPRARLDDAVEELVSSFRARSRAALAATKAAMNEGASLPLDRALDVELEHFMRFLARPGSDEGYRAYVEKRAPEWP